MHYHPFHACTLQHHGATACTSFPWLSPWMWMLWKWIGGTRVNNSPGKGADSPSPSPPSSLLLERRQAHPLKGDTSSPGSCFWSAQQQRLQEGTGTCQPWNFASPALWRLPEPGVVSCCLIALNEYFTLRIWTVTLESRQALALSSTGAALLQLHAQRPAAFCLF